MPDQPVINVYTGDRLTPEQQAEVARKREEMVEGQARDYKTRAKAEGPAPATATAEPAPPPAKAGK